MGSMQLMAGVKLCTGRPITNHPHYEDKDLRIKTKQVRKLTVILDIFIHNLSLVVRKPVFGVSDQVQHKPGCAATDDG